MTDERAERDAVVLERHFEAPVELVWRMWTEPEHFEAWYGPTGATVTVKEMDVRVGGRRHVGMEMQTPDGPLSMWFAGEHRVVARPERLVYTESHADEHGDPVPAPAGMPSAVPETTEVTVALEAADGGTDLVLTHVGVPADSPGATGWTMALDALAERLGAAGSS